MLTLLKFEAQWCAPCKQMQPIVEQVAKKYADKLVVRAIDVDLPKNSDLMMDHGVRAIPTLVLIEGDEKDDRSRVLGTLRGSVSLSELKKFIDHQLDTVSA